MQNIETNRVENKEQLNEDFEQEVIAFLNYKEGEIIYVGVRKDGQAIGVQDIDLMQLQIKEDFFRGVTAPKNQELIRVFKDVDLIENIRSGILRILKAYDKNSFIFMDKFCILLIFFIFFI